MLKLSDDELAQLEKKYPGIRQTIDGYETSFVPACRECGSDDTATVQVGLVGRSMTLAAATSRVRLIANGPKLGKYFCNSCERYFDDEEGARP